MRPRISSDSSDFARLPDEGAAEQTVSRAVSNYAAKTSWGVTGNINGSYAEGNIQVQAFAQVGSTMYVGGNSPASSRARTAPRSPRAASPPST